MLTNLLLFAAVCIICISGTFKVENCLIELGKGRSTIRSVAGQLVAEEHQRQLELLSELRMLKPSKSYKSKRFISKDTSQCPQPNATIFPPPTTKAATTTATTTTTTTTTVITTTVEETTPNPSDLTSLFSVDENDASTSTDEISGPLDEISLTHANYASERETRTKKRGSTASIREELIVPSMFHTDLQSDPYVYWMSKLHSHLSRDEAVCSGPRFKNIQSITNDQLWGFFSLLLANHGNPLCSVCDRMISRMEQKFLHPNPILLTDEEMHIHRVMFAYFPKTKAICSMLLPSCYADYEVKAANTTNATICMECSLCMTALTLVQHRFLLNPQTLKDALAWLDGSFIHNICAELCLEFPPGQSDPDSFFPNGVDYDACVNFGNEAFTFAVDAAKNILKPEYFCSVELKWCEVNETPNALHCLKQICEEGLPIQLSSTICELIPADAELADKYLNINRKSKGASQRNSEERPQNWKTEL